MALNLHQALKRREEEEVTGADTASYYNLDLHCAIFLDSTHIHTHTHIGYSWVQSPDRCLPGLQACHISFLGTFSFHFKCITFQTLPFCTAPCDAKKCHPEHTVAAQDTFQPQNSISSLPTASVSLGRITNSGDRSPLVKTNKSTRPLVHIFYSPASGLKIHIYNTLLGCVEVS